jgi:uncharacterized membrane protein
MWENWAIMEGIFMQMARFAPWGGRLFGLFWLLLLLGFIALVVVGVIWVVRGSARTSPAAPVVTGSQDQALTTLRMRYAKGELSREEFLVAARDLGDTSLPPPEPTEPPKPPAAS